MQQNQQQNQPKDTQIPPPPDLSRLPLSVTGAKFGLTPAELNYIRNDTHTLYNTPPY